MDSYLSETHPHRRYDVYTYRVCPFHVRDIEVYTDVGVVRAELLVDKDDILTDPEDDSNCYHTPPLLWDAAVPGRGGTHSKVHNSNTKPAGLGYTHVDVVSHGKSDNTFKEGSSRRDSRRSISQGIDSTLPTSTVRKRVRFEGHRHDDRKLSAIPQSLTETSSVYSTNRFRLREVGYR